MNKRRFLVLPFFFLTACHLGFDKKIEGNGNRQTIRQNLSGFSALEVTGPFQVTVQQGETYSISVEADENLLPYINIAKNGKELEISEKEDTRLKSKEEIRIMVQLPEIEAISVTGSGLVKSASTLNSKNKIDLEITGSGSIQTELDAPTIHTSITGSGTATLSGRTRDLDLNLSGSGECLSEALKSEQCRVNISGSGTAKVYASTTLDATIGGSGDVFYAGQPKITQSIGGSGRIKPL